MPDRPSSSGSGSGSAATTECLCQCDFHGVTDKQKTISRHLPTIIHCGSTMHILRIHLCTLCVLCVCVWTMHFYTILFMPWMLAAMQFASSTCSEINRCKSLLLVAVRECLCVCNFVNEHPLSPCVRMPSEREVVANECIALWMRSYVDFVSLTIIIMISLWKMNNNGNGEWQAYTWKVDDY